ncbi:MAG TPA: hypothetical protein VMS76_03560 [Planctomycetota bacterium]|nr:hypothetical protein [Planctomycetota bacterium]
MKEADAGTDATDGIAVFGNALLESPWLAGQDPPFLEKYSGYSLEQLRGAHQTLRTRCLSEAERIAAERMRRGVYETEYVPTGGAARGIGPMGERPVASFGVSTERGEGYTLVNTSVIDPVQHPEFDLLEKEAWWLGSLVKKIESEAKAK